MSESGRICRKNVILETKKIFLGNKMEDPYDEKEGLSNEQIKNRVEMSDMELGVFLLDPRTLFDVSILDWEGRNKSFKVLEDEYIEVYLV